MMSNLLFVLSALSLVRRWLSNTFPSPKNPGVKIFLSDSKKIEHCSNINTIKLAPSWAQPTGFITYFWTNTPGNTWQVYQKSWTFWELLTETNCFSWWLQKSYNFLPLYGKYHSLTNSLYTTFQNLSQVFGAALTLLLTFWRVVVLIANMVLRRGDVPPMQCLSQITNITSP